MFELLFIDLNVYVLSVRTMLTFAPVLWFVMRATGDLDVRPFGLFLPSKLTHTTQEAGPRFWPNVLAVNNDVTRGISV